MKKLRKQNIIAEQRKQGQAIAEGAVMLSILIFAGVLLLLFLVNATVMATYTLKVNAVATETARSIGAHEYWLGMKRPDYDPAETTRNARQLADAMLDNFGLPHTTSFAVREDQVNIGSNTEMVTRVDMTISGVRISGGGIFPPFITLHATGIGYDNAVPPYATMALSFTDPERVAAQNGSTVGSKGVLFPIYFAKNTGDGPGANPNVSSWRPIPSTNFCGSGWWNLPGAQQPPMAIGRVIGPVHESDANDPWGWQIFNAGTHYPWTP